MLRHWTGLMAWLSVWVGLQAALRFLISLPEQSAVGGFAQQLGGAADMLTSSPV